VEGREREGRGKERGGERRRYLASLRETRVKEMQKCGSGGWLVATAASPLQTTHVQMYQTVLSVHTRMRRVAPEKARSHLLKRMTAMETDIQITT
jgi:hypothetical protein